MRRVRDGSVVARARPASRRRHPVQRRRVHQPDTRPPRFPWRHGELLRRQTAVVRDAAADAPAIINVDDPRGVGTGRCRRRVRSRTGSASRRTCRQDRSRIRSPDCSSRFAPRRARCNVRSRLVGRPNVYNILAAAAATAARRCSARRDRAGSGQLPGVPGRFELVSTPDDDVTVVVDYAHTDDALRNLLETARRWRRIG